MRDERANGDSEAFDLIGVGFGPSNLALAVCARELDAGRRCLFFEQHPQVQWHPGMMFDGARMQISFLKDLVTLRNPASPFTFLRYVQARGRLEQFVNLNQFRPTRLEYQDYLRWVAAQLPDQVRYGAAVRRVTPVAAPGGRELSRFRVEVEELATGRRSTWSARNVVCAAGGRPRAAPGQAPGVVHASEFLLRFPRMFAERARPYVFAVIGAGQSAGEIAAYLLERYEEAQVHLVISGYAPRPTDNSPFVNEQFFHHRADELYRAGEAKRAALLEELRGANYGVIREDLLDHLYGAAYLDAVKGRRRLVLHTCSTLSRVREQDGRPCATIEDRFGGPGRELGCDGVVLATGYERALDPEVFADVLPLLVEEAPGRLALTRSCRVKAVAALRAGFYAQGYGEASFGLGDTLLSLLPFRSREIFEDLCARTPAEAAAPAEAAPERRRARAPYPPRPFLEQDPEKLYAVMERFPFATVISARGPDEPVVTQVPLTLERARGGQGVLFGHLDRANPHVELLDGREVLVLFHGPSAYISPGASRGRQLPTWNSITVRVRGRATLLEGRAARVRCLCGLAERSERGVLGADDPRIDAMLELIAAFEIEIAEIVGRFKLSQDRSEPDRRAAALALAHRTEAGERSFIEYAVGIPLTAQEADGANGASGA